MLVKHHALCVSMCCVNNMYMNVMIVSVCILQNNTDNYRICLYTPYYGALCSASDTMHAMLYLQINDE